MNKRVRILAVEDDARSLLRKDRLREQWSSCANRLILSVCVFFWRSSRAEGGPDTQCKQPRPGSDAQICASEG